MTYINVLLSKVQNILELQCTQKMFNQMQMQIFFDKNPKVVNPIFRFISEINLLLHHSNLIHGQLIIHIILQIEMEIR